MLQSKIRNAWSDTKLVTRCLESISPATTRSTADQSSKIYFKHSGSITNLMFRMIRFDVREKEFNQKRRLWALNLALFRGGFLSFWICLINSFHCSGQWSWMFLLLFTNVELSFSRCCSWLKGEPPGTRTLAAGSQKNEIEQLQQHDPYSMLFSMTHWRSHLSSDPVYIQARGEYVDGQFCGTPPQ